MTALQTIIVTFSMFSAIPMPRISWNEKNMRWSLCAFPLVGLLIGLCCWLWMRLCLALSIPDLLRGAGLCLLPVLITGGIHLDGYADTCDALASHGDMEKMQNILKDPHLGAFAAIRLCCYFVAAYALWTVLQETSLAVFLGLFGLTRSLSGVALTLFPMRPGGGLARSFAEAADRKGSRFVLLAESAIYAALLVFSGMVMLPVAALFVFFLYYHVSRKAFDGVSGDLAGWFLQKAEFWMLAMLVLTQIGREWL